MLIRSRGSEPVVDTSAFVAPTAVLVGRVLVGPGARVMYGAVLLQDLSKEAVGALLPSISPIAVKYAVGANISLSIYSKASAAGLRLRARLDPSTDKVRLSLV